MSSIDLCEEKWNYIQNTLKRTFLKQEYPGPYDVPDDIDLYGRYEYYMQIINNPQKIQPSEYLNAKYNNVKKIFYCSLSFLDEENEDYNEDHLPIIEIYYLLNNGVYVYFNTSYDLETKYANIILADSSEKFEYILRMCNKYDKNYDFYV
jgi:hypothetical protein